MKNYVAPVSAVLSMNMNENIASSSKTVYINNNTYYLVDGMIEGLEGLEVAGHSGSTSLWIASWSRLVATDEEYDRLINVCSVSPVEPI